MSDLNVHGDCELCSEHHALVGEIVEGHRTVTHQLCGTCWEQETFRCPDCREHFWSREGVRVFNISDLYCPRDAKTYPHVAESLDGDARRAEMNEVRR